MAAFQLKNEGYCSCCRQTTIFESNDSWLREGYLCLNCKSIPRQRHLQYILDRHFPGWENKKVHESSTSNNYIKQYCSTYTSSQFFLDTPLGDQKNGIRCENLEQLTFSDETFDIFITQDVFEHIFDIEKASNEIMRVLKAPGIHIFTAPKHKELNKTIPRAELINGQIKFLEPPQYHGNPIGDHKSLVTWDYGDDFEYLIGKYAKVPVTTYITRDLKLGLDGEFLEVFVMKKF